MGGVYTKEGLAQRPEGAKEEVRLPGPAGQCSWYTHFMPTQSLDIDPRVLHVPPSRMSGADPLKLHRQIALFGPSTAGMPAPWAYRGSDGELQLYNDVTRATRIAKLLPGTLIRVEVVGSLGSPVGHLPTIGDLVP
jgi:hypothetical protein